MTTNEPEPERQPDPTPDLESRIAARRAQLRGRLRELATDRRVEAVDARVKLKAMLSELAHVVKWGAVDGWASLGGPVTDKLEQWLAGSAHPLTTNHENHSDGSGGDVPPRSTIGR